MAANIIEVTDTTFEELVLKSEKPVAVDFWAPWCKPCLMMAPLFEEFSTEFQDQLTFAKLNTDDNYQTAGKLGIQGIPTLIFFHKGHEVKRVIGFEPREPLRRHIVGAIAAAV